jgi:hypothetical protein
MLHAIQLGLAIPEHKLGALQQGDLSGTLIHPTLVHAAHLWGCFFFQQTNAIRRPEEEVHLCDIVIGTLGACETSIAERKVLLQSYCLLALYLFARRQGYLGREFLVRASRIVNDMQLPLSIGVTSSDGTIAQWVPDDSCSEDIGAVCQFLYLDRFMDVVLQLPSACSVKLHERFQDIITV